MMWQLEQNYDPLDDLRIIQEMMLRGRYTDMKPSYEVRYTTGKVIESENKPKVIHFYPFSDWL